MLLNAGNTSGRLFLDMARFFPGYANIMAFILNPDQQGLVGLEKMNESHFLHPPQSNEPLNYPTRVNLQCVPAAQPMNLVIILIDAWRFDMLNKQVMPTLSTFANQSLLFTQHSSGGNATGPGVFSLFYSIPVTYQAAVTEQHRGPLFIDELLHQQYQIGIFASANLRWPFFDKTVFQAIPNLQPKAPGHSAYQRDIATTDEFQQFLTMNTQSGKPFFSFLFYDGVHSYCDYDEDKKPFTPVTNVCNRFRVGNDFNREAYLNRYRNAVLLVDKQIERVITTLKERHLLQHTIIVVTGDHGEEFDDNHLGYLNHAGNFTRYQVQTPLIVYWPGQAPHIFSHQTTHYDVVPTLMSGLLHCQADVSRYSVGVNLFDMKHRPYFIAGSYVDYAIVEPDRATVIYPLGNYEITDATGRVIATPLNMPVLKSAFHDVHRFYRGVL